MTWLVIKREEFSALLAASFSEQQQMPMQRNPHYSPEMDVVTRGLLLP